MYKHDFRCVGSKTNGVDVIIGKNTELRKSLKVTI